LQLKEAEGKVLDEISSDPQAQQEALARLKGKSVSRASARTSSSKPGSKQEAHAQLITVALPPKNSDAISELLSKNTNKPASERQYSKCPGWVPLLRQDWKDLGNAVGNECPDSVDSAQGAQISFANDMVANNRTTTIQGTAALIYNSVTGNSPDQLTPYAISFGAYTTVNDINNTAAKQAGSNTDTLAYGGLVDLGFATSTGGNFFRVRGGGVQDFLNRTDDANVVLEWLPVYTPLYIHKPINLPFGLPIIVRLIRVWLHDTTKLSDTANP
jgi:hypothetical protein